MRKLISAVLLAAFVLGSFSSCRSAGRGKRDKADRAMDAEYQPRRGFR